MNVVHVAAALLPKVAIKALEARKHEHWVEGLLLQLAAPVPCTSEPAVDA